MDKNVNSFDALYAEVSSHRPLMPWDALLRFVRRFPQIAAFNAALIAQQRSGAIFVETERAWLEKYHRLLTDDAQALIVLHPFTPVRFVFDIDDTLGPDVPAEAIRPFSTAEPPTWDGVRAVLATLNRKHVSLQDLPSTKSATVMLSAVLFELAALCAGHRGAWPRLGIVAADTTIDGAQKQFETECIAWLIAGRIGLRMPAVGSLKGYLNHGALMPPVSRDRVLHTVNVIERLFGGAMALGETIREDVPSLFSFAGLGGQSSLPA